MDVFRFGKYDTFLFSLTVVCLMLLAPQFLSSLLRSSLFVLSLPSRYSSIIFIVTIPIDLNDNHVSTYRGLISISLFALQQRYDPCIRQNLRGDRSKGHRKSAKDRGVTSKMHLVSSNHPFPTTNMAYMSFYTQLPHSHPIHSYVLLLAIFLKSLISHKALYG
jgi:hypothetical protein